MLRYKMKMEDAVALYIKYVGDWGGESTSHRFEAIKDGISGQNSDGFGEGFEQREIHTDDGDLYVSFWQSGNDYFVHTQSEMDEYINQGQGLKMGGM
jgi:hypothetical protein